MQIFYHPGIDETSSFFSFDTAASKHLIKVMRKQTGDVIRVTNGRGWHFTAELVDPDPKKCTLKVNEATQQNTRNYTLHLAVAPTKMNDRYEWFLEKAVEIGVDEITPVICHHSERKHSKPERFRRIIISAMKQSLQYQLPKLRDAVTFEDFIRQPFNGQRFIAHCKDSERDALHHKASANRAITVLIGPEGDFSEAELRLAVEKGFIPVSLGQTRLRTETAAVVACHTIALINE